MTRYRMEDGAIVDTALARQSWNERREFNGNNHISVHTGSQWGHQTLYCSKKGRYYVEHESDWQGSTAHVEWVSPQEATRWLLLNESPLPADLAHLESEVVE
jgi:hypothetical protein